MLPLMLALRTMQYIHYQRSPCLLPSGGRGLCKHVHRPAFPGIYPSSFVVPSLLLFFPRREEHPCLRLLAVLGDPRSKYTHPSKYRSSQKRQALGVPSVAIEGQIVQPNRQQQQQKERVVFKCHRDGIYIQGPLAL